MPSPSQAALRHALLDPESRVRLDSDEERPARPSLVAIHWEGGFLDTRTVPLAEELNVLIGAPGAGKSTVIESLRAAFELTPASDRARSDHSAILDKVLRNGTAISVVVDHPHPTQIRYVLERRMPNPTVVRRADSWELSDRSIADLQPIPDIYGQHQIADLATDSTRRTELLRRFVGRDTEADTRFEQTVQGLTDSRVKVLAAAMSLETLQAELSLLPGSKNA
jgi:DNA repair ATPase RecN